MPRRADPKCIACAQLSAEKARQLHGPQGDGCWNERRCHRKRSHYRNRREQNEKRRTNYRQQVAQQRADSRVETVSLAVTETSIPYANLYIWREKRKDAPVHAIAATVIQNGQKVLEVKPIHCAGYRKRQLERYMEQKVMPYLKERFGITHFSNEIRLEPIECPLKDCPLKEKFGAADD
ncbi:hypothetical protein N836_03390 [Leptolyngbya sp. Heron Island J]|uniref:hypothetical protein n=1 Tax=Leptolyngbya sp. Heron Island J TaxID=1385935 RepID=UPI0003B96CB2|nr:hypothetical protein [Leptolyngbya sp. Heron Island J]ESA37362.1 hypothetical protein N836_03390 [Leptolyngbya sp. Heron Island J]